MTHIGIYSEREREREERMIMDKICDDTLAQIFSCLHDPEDRNSFSIVSKRFLSVEGLHRSFWRVLRPNFLYEFLPTFPNLICLEVSKPISNAQIEFVAKTCPRIQVFNLSLTSNKLTIEDDIGVDGICAMAQGCRELREVSLRKRSRVGDFGVVSLMNLAMNLTELDLGRCNLASDFALKAIGNSKTITSLNLQGCSWVTDRGLDWLGKGSISKILKTLVIAECDQISDFGVSLLKRMHILEILDISDCGPKVKDSGCSHITTIGTLKKLNLARLGNITDVTVNYIVWYCLELEDLDLTGCDLITNVHIPALLDLHSLKSLVLPCSFKYSIKCEAGSPRCDEVQ